MKLKATKKEIKENNNYILSVGYCEMQYLLRGCEPFAYSCGVFGWSCDYYKINTGKNKLIISTGYNPINDQGLTLPNNFYKIVRKYDKEAQKIYSENDYTKATKKINKLLYKLIDKEIFKNN